MGRVLKAICFGAAGAFDLSGGHFRQHTRQALQEITERNAAMKAFRQSLDSNSTRKLSVEESLASDWTNIGNDLRKAISIETASLK